MSVCVAGEGSCMCVSAEARRGCQLPLEMELQVVVICVAWVLGTEPRFLTGAVNALKH